MGFALWHRKPLLFCAGTHEYRPLGTAIVGDQGLFQTDDFSSRRSAPRRGTDGFIGYFASLNEVNAYLRSPQSAGTLKRNCQRNPHRILATF